MVIRCWRCPAFSPAICRWRRCGDTSGNSDTTPMPGRWAAISAAYPACAARDGLTEIHESTGRKASIVGWSLGGVYARDLALQLPDMVRAVITLGSPFANDVRATNATRLYEALSGEAVDADPELRAAIAGD